MGQRRPQDMADIELGVGAICALGSLKADDDVGKGALLFYLLAYAVSNLGAFGATGPLRDKPGYDPMMQAYSGLMSLLGEDGRPPVRVCRNPVQ